MVAEGAEQGKGFREQEWSTAPGPGFRCAWEGVQTVGQRPASQPSAGMGVTCFIHRARECGRDRRGEGRRRQGFNSEYTECDVL